jgi:hypothetical protein
MGAGRIGPPGPMEVLGLASLTDWCAVLPVLLAVPQPDSPARRAPAAMVAAAAGTRGRFFTDL